MQLRDDRPDIFYPDHWGCFGGAIETGETAEQALIRELKEELSFQPRDPVQIGRFVFELPGLGFLPFERIFYEVRIADADLDGMVLGEGAEMRAFDPHHLLARERVTPYDAFALLFYLNHRRDAGIGAECR